MIYESNNIYYLKKGDLYEMATVSIKYSRAKGRNVIVINGEGYYVDKLEEPIKEYTFKELEDKLTA